MNRGRKRVSVAVGVVVTMIALAVVGGTLLVLERSFDGDSTGFAKNTIGIYEVDVRRATDVSGIAALRGMHFTPVEKRKLIELTCQLSNTN